MKRLKILGMTAVVLSLFLMATLLVLDNRIFPEICAGLLLLLTSFLVYQTRKEEKLMDFLIRDNKKNQHTTVSWNKEEEEKLELLRKRVDLSTLQMQINPHFLYNTLDTIRSQALMNQQKDIAVMTEKLSRFFRYCISNRENMVKIQEELDHIQDYSYIQKRRFGERFEMKVEVEQEEIYEYYIPKLTLQPLVENAIAHGLEKVSRKGVITIEIAATEKKVILCIRDNGIGIAEEELEQLNEQLRLRQVRIAPKRKKGNGIAAANVNSRIKLTFGEEYGIHYRSIEQVGTEAVVTLPRVDDFSRVQYERLLTQEE